MIPRIDVKGRRGHEWGKWWTERRRSTWDVRLVRETVGVGDRQEMGRRAESYRVSQASTLRFSRSGDRDEISMKGRRIFETGTGNVVQVVAGEKIA